MFRLFLFDIFQTDEKLKILFRVLNKIIQVLLVSFIIYFFKKYILKDISLLKVDVLFFGISFCIALLTNYNPQRIIQDPAVRKNKGYKLLFIFSNFIFSLPSVIYFVFLLLYKENQIFFVLHYMLFMFSILFMLCFDKKNIIKIIVFLIDCIFLFFNNFIFTTSFIVVLVVCFIVFYRNCFDEYKTAQIKSAVLEHVYNKNIRVSAIITEWLFIFREKKSLLAISFFCPFAIVLFFYFLKLYNPDILVNSSDIRILLLSSFVTGSFGTFIGPYMINWFYYYSIDLISKNISIRNIIRAKIDLIRLFTLVLFILTTPFIFIYKLDFLMMVYFFLMNISISVFVSIFIGIMEISKIDMSKSPRLKVEKGSLIATYVPWICEVIPVGFYYLLSNFLSEYFIVLISIMIFIILNLRNEKIMDSLVLLIERKINSEN